MSYRGRDSGDEDISAAEVVAGVFEKAGWSVSRNKPARDGPDLVIRHDGIHYVVEVKRASEARVDRLIPLVSQAVLQVRSWAGLVPAAKPLVVIVGKSIPPRLLEHVKQFMQTYASDIAIGFVDERGLKEFSGAGLEVLNHRPSALTSGHAFTSVSAKPVHLFSDLGQWLLKVLLAPDVGDSRLLNAPVARYHNASELARAAGVSGMTAFRFLAALKSNGYLHESSEFIRLVRVNDLAERWRAAVARPVVTVAARWLFPGEKQVQVKHFSDSLGQRACLALYAAADALGLGIARGVPIHFYVRRVPEDLGATLGLVRVRNWSDAQVFLSVPSSKESVFRATVIANGVYSCDALQTWLDVSHDPIRGKEQAEHIYRHVIGPMIERASKW